jgi:hypothetical protein
MSHVNVKDDRVGLIRDDAAMSSLWDELAGFVCNEHRYEHVEHNADRCYKALPCHRFSPLSGNDRRDAFLILAGTLGAFPSGIPIGNVMAQYRADHREQDRRQSFAIKTLSGDTTSDLIRLARDCGVAPQRIRGPGAGLFRRGWTLGGYVLCTSGEWLQGNPEPITNDRQIPLPAGWSKIGRINGPVGRQLWPITAESAQVT